MSKIGNIAASGAVTFTISYLPQFLQIGEVTDNSTFSAINISRGGNPLIVLSNAAQLDTLMKLEMSPLVAGANSTLPKQLLLADGRIEGQTTITLNQSSANTSDVYEHSIGMSAAKVLRKVAVTPVIAEGNNSFANFDVIYMLPTNVDRVRVTYENGWSEDLTPAEIAAMYAANHPVEASGYVNGFIVIEGYRAPNGYKVVQANVYATAGGNANVVVCGWEQV